MRDEGVRQASRAVPVQASSHPASRFQLALCASHSGLGPTTQPRTHPASCRRALHLIHSSVAPASSRRCAGAACLRGHAAFLRA